MPTGISLRAFSVAACCLGLMTGCADKIAARERGNLAKSQMSLEPRALDAAIMQHTFSSKEAASGGYGVGGGGCGCN